MEKIKKKIAQKSESVYFGTEEEYSVSMEEMEEAVNKMRQELGKAQEEVKELTQQLATTVPRSQMLQMRRELEAKIEEVISDNQELTETVEDLRKEKEWAEKELRTQYEATAITDKEMHNLQEFIKKLHSLQEEKGKAVEAQKEEREAMGRLLEEAKEEVTRLKKESGVKTRGLNRLEETHKELLSLFKVKDEELTVCQKEAVGFRRQYEQLQKELIRQNERRSEVESQLKVVRGQVKVSTEQVRVRTRMEKMAQQKIGRLVGEKEGLQRSVVKALAQEKKQEGLVLLGEKEKRKCQNHLIKAMLDLHQQDKLVNELQESRDRQMEVTAQVESKVVELAAQVEFKEKESDTLFRQQILLKANLDRGSVVNDTLRSENFAIARQLNLLQAEKGETEEKEKEMRQLLDKMTDLNKLKEEEVSDLTADVSFQKLEQHKLKERLKGNEKEMKQHILTLQYTEGEKVGIQSVVEKQEIALEEFQKLIREEENQRGMELTTLNRRNDEVCALQSKVKLLEHILMRGHKEFEAQSKKMKVLTNQLESLKNERNVLLQQAMLVKSLKEALVRQQKNLVGTLKKQTYLQTAFVNRKGLHSWTTQEIEDARFFDLMMKNQNLQKRYLSATERTAALEMEISQRSREVEEMRRLVERTAFDSHQETIAPKMSLQNKLWAKEEQLKSVTAALNAALLKQEECEDEKKRMKTKMHQFTLRITQLQKKNDSLRRQIERLSSQKSE